MENNSLKLSGAFAAAVAAVILALIFPATRLYAAGLASEAQGSDANQTQTDAARDNNSKRPMRVVVTGDSIVQAQPDTAILSISVVTQNRRALDAQTDNANKSDAVIRALKTAAGAGAEIKTGGYNLQPQRVYKENQPPTITGYEARNTVTVTLADLTKVGAVIDAASQAGANNVDGIAFTLRKDQAARMQALTGATREAMAKAQAVAQALGARVVRVVEVQEGGGYVRPLDQIAQASEGVMMRARVSAPTPVEVGTLDIRSQVQLIAEIETAQ